MRKPHGYFVCVDPDPPRGQFGTIERDFFSCNHCSAWIRVKPGQDPAEAGRLEDVNDRRGGICSKCCDEGEYICKACKQRGGCTPIDLACEIIEGPVNRLKAVIRQDEDRARFLREVFGVR